MVYLDPAIGVPETVNIQWSDPTWSPLTATLSPSMSGLTYSSSLYVVILVVGIIAAVTASYHSGDLLISDEVTSNI
jgi:hypothetical protein